MKKSVLILANEYDLCSHLVHKQLKSMKIPTLNIPENRYLEAKLNWEIGDEERSYIEFMGNRLTFNEITGVFTRYSGHLNTSGYEESDKDYVIQETKATLLAWLNAIPGVIINRPKPETSFGNILQLQELYHILKIPEIHLPKTLITNNLDEAKIFHKSCEKKTRFKPFLTSSYYELEGDNIRYVEPITPELPLRLEETLTGFPYSVYVIGEEAICIKDGALSYDASAKALTLTKDISRLLRTEFLQVDILVRGGETCLEKIDFYPKYYQTDKKVQMLLTNKIVNRLIGDLSL